MAGERRAGKSRRAVLARRRCPQHAGAAVAGRVVRSLRDRTGRRVALKSAHEQRWMPDCTPRHFGRWRGLSGASHAVPGIIIVYQIATGSELHGWRAWPRGTTSADKTPPLTRRHHRGHARYPVPVTSIGWPILISFGGQAPATA